MLRKLVAVIVALVPFAWTPMSRPLISRITSRFTSRTGRLGDEC